MRVARGIGGGPSASSGGIVLNRQSRSTRPSKRSDRSCATTPPRSPRADREPLVAELARTSAAMSARVGGHVVAVVRARAASRRSRAGRGRSPRSRPRRAARRCAPRCAASRASRGSAAAACRPRPAWSSASERHRNATVPLRPHHGGPLRPQDDRAQVAARLGRRAHLGGLERARRAPQVLRARDAALPLGRAAHRPPEELLAWATRSPTSGGATATACCTRWATTRSGCRPRTTRSRPASTRASRPRRRSPSSSASSASWGISIDWTREFGTHEPRVLPLDPVDLPAPVRARAWPTARRPRSSGAPTTPTVLANEQVIDGRCERCGHLVEVRQLEQWFFRITDYADRLLDDMRDDRLAAPRRDDAGELDRPLRGRRGDLPLRGARHRLPGLHHAAGHAVRRDLLRDGARAPRRASG